MQHQAGLYEYHGVVSMNMNANVGMNDVPIIAAPVRTMRWR